MAYAQQNPIKITVVGLHGKILDVQPWSNFLRFHAVFGTFWPNNWLTPPRIGLALRPLGNPGCDAGSCPKKLSFVQIGSVN